jgi:hypothetical protein
MYQRPVRDHGAPIRVRPVRFEPHFVLGPDSALVLLIVAVVLPFSATAQSYRPSASDC